MQNSNRQGIAFLLVAWALVFGAYIRILPVSQAGFPLNDGGLFYTMTADLQRSGYTLPAETSYNGLDIPFAYPPLPFYLAGLAQSLSAAPLDEVVRWLPVFFSLLTLPAFYLLARALLADPLAAALASAIFATLPRAYEWLIMGGGVTRAPAALFLILMVWSAYRLLTAGGWKYVLVTAISGSLVILTHPERALHAAVAGALLWLFFGRTRARIWQALLVAGAVVLLTAPWWVLVLAREGTAPFQLALQAGSQRWLFWAPLLQLNFTDEPIPLAAVLAVFGFFACLLKKDIFLPVWLVLAFLSDPRSAPHVVPVQVSLLAALGLVDVVFPALARLAPANAQPENTSAFLARSAGRWMMGYILLVLLAGAIINTQTLATYRLSEEDRSALAWVRTHTPPGSRFLVLAWQNDAMLSPILEWFPALGERTSISTVQGREWLPGAQHYTARMETFAPLQTCLYRDLTCLDEWAEKQAERFDHVYLSLGSPARSSVLALSLRESDRYMLVHETPAVLIFSRR